MIEFFRRAGGSPARLGILPGTFNPPTLAHVGLASAALSRVDEVLFVLPHVFPHKVYEGAAFEERIEMLRLALSDEQRFSIGASGAGLFIEIARECRGAYGEDTGLSFLCGRDAAERVVNWDYGEPEAFPRMLEVFELLVASRNGEYQPPPGMRHRIHPLPLQQDFDEVSATRVRESIARGHAWEHLVAPTTIPLIRRTYR